MLTPDFKEFIGLLNEHDVRYLVVGGYAVAFHGHPRYTKDMDVWVWLDKENAERMMLALDAFGFGSLGLQTEDFLAPDQVVQLGYPPNRIDIIASLEGVSFDDCYVMREVLELEDTTVNFIDLENLKEQEGDRTLAGPGRFRKPGRLEVIYARARFF